jgi:5-formyltetrahydrofolate cyclo-ligase
VNAGPLKDVLRGACRARRRQMAPGQLAGETTATVARCEQLIAAAGAAAAGLGSYLAYGSELDLDGLHRGWWAAGRTLWLPRVAGPGTLAWHAFGPDEVARPGSLIEGAFGLPEPDPAVVPAGTLPAHAVLLVPGLAFGADGRRLGQGGGFYDRMLVRHHGPTIGVGFACQRQDGLPVEDHDHPLTAVVLGGEVVRAPEGWLAH